MKKEETLVKFNTISYEKESSVACELSENANMHWIFSRPNHRMEFQGIHYSPREKKKHDTHNIQSNTWSF